MGKSVSNRFKQIVHYILWYCKKDTDNNLSNVKLNKIIWLLDVWQYCHKGDSMSGEKFYIKRQFGPVPTCILAACEELDTQGVLQIKGVTETGRIDIGKANVIEPKSSDLKTLSQDELKQIEKFCDSVKDMTSHELSQYSHDEVYDTYEIGDQIPLDAYLLAKTVKPTEDDIKQAREIFGL